MKKLSKTIKKNSQDDNVQVKQAEVVGDELDAAIEEVITSHI